MNLKELTLELQIKNENNFSCDHWSWSTDLRQQKKKLL